LEHTGVLATKAFPASGKGGDDQRAGRVARVRHPTIVAGFSAAIADDGFQGTEEEGQKGRGKRERERREERVSE